MVTCWKLSHPTAIRQSHGPWVFLFWFSFNIFGGHLPARLDVCEVLGFLWWTGNGHCFNQFFFLLPFFLPSFLKIFWNLKQKACLKAYLLGNLPHLLYWDFLAQALHFNSIQSRMWMAMSIKERLRKSVTIYDDFLMEMLHLPFNHRIRNFWVQKLQDFHTQCPPFTDEKTETPVRSTYSYIPT